MPAQRPSFKRAVEWVALEDSPGSVWEYRSEALEDLRGWISVALVADLFGKPALEVATAVLDYREAHGLNPVTGRTRV